MYLDFQKYGIDKFSFQVIEEVEEAVLKEKEQQFIETLKPTYNNINAKGLNIERNKESHKKANKKYYKSDKGKKIKKEYYQKHKEYQKEYQSEYQKSDKSKKTKKEYNNQLCLYNGETLTLCALSTRFRRQGITNPTLEAKKYLIQR